MKLLVVSSFLPYPLFSGGHVRLYNILKRLSKNHEITLVCEKRPYQTQGDSDEIKKICKAVYTIDRKKQWSLKNIISTAVSFYPFLLVGHSLPAMKEKIAEVLQNETFDLIHVETFYVYQNLPHVTIPVVLIEHNIEYLVYERYVKTKSSLLSPVLSLDIAKLKRWETYYWGKATKLVAVSEQEKALMKRNDVVVVPNGVDTKKFKPPHFAKASSGEQSSKFKNNKEEKRVLFIGDFKWVQNKDSAVWILQEIWPRVLKKISEHKPKTTVKLWIVSRSIPEEIKKIYSDHVIFDENASEETAEIFKQADILLAPIRVGGGTSFKILEAMASGVAVVTTSLGIEGIDARNNKEILVADTAQTIADRIVLLLFHENLYKKITQNSRILIEEKYNWDTIVKKLEEVYRSAVSS